MHQGVFVIFDFITVKIFHAVNYFLPLRVVTTPGQKGVIMMAGSKVTYPVHRNIVGFVFLEIL